MKSRFRSQNPGHQGPHQAPAYTQRLPLNLSATFKAQRVPSPAARAPLQTQGPNVGQLPGLDPNQPLLAGQAFYLAGYPQTSGAMAHEGNAARGPSGTEGSRVFGMSRQ